jgi:hypothetical protein
MSPGNCWRYLFFPIILCVFVGEWMSGQRLKNYKNNPPSSNSKTCWIVCENNYCFVVNSFSLSLSFSSSHYVCVDLHKSTKSLNLQPVVDICKSFDGRYVSILLSISCRQVSSYQDHIHESEQWSDMKE